MANQALAFSAPLPASMWEQDHPALRFYAAYLKDFSQNYKTADPEAYYAADCRMVMPDASVVEGGSHIWEYVGRELYGRFAKVTREILSLIVVSDEAARQTQVDLPQAFVYTLGQADEGKGTHGLQYRELKCYYDRGILDGAKATM